ncbi:Zinc transport system ATP-binding protein [Ignavibacterium album JCM 16511]|uniref:Zinc transport system ATP-binding protein n=1 Tax=Ignavibacterium album (strain DSM 19864 / JCM 16511 / NBRC 101810 / Mat9-16) TaxID=945713 RepID=I0ANC0_IGNAJ|nr:metal ABC transporter ATP-binding protein [Ignavibacterium album]AFH50477.1 Zinc transport system ATP-binding protein [Ignavibacterium album JCM 16511]
MNAVEVKNLSLSYGDIKVLENLNFNIPENSFVSIVGPNGAGKTTLMKILLGLIKDYSGEIKIFDKHPDEIDPHLIGYVPQIKTMDRNFPALSIELVASGLLRKWPWSVKGYDKENSIKALEMVKAEHLAYRPITELSGGELQRVCLARSIVRNPKLVVLDEPATGIDAIGEADLYNLLEAYQNKSNATVLMITHDWHVAHHHSDYVLLLNRKQVSFGHPEEALSEQNLRTAFGHIGHEHKVRMN